jgi:vancomycin resistance protein YoaR
MNGAIVARCAAAAVLAAILTAAAWRPASRDLVLGGYSTSLAARTPAQRANAIRAAWRLNGARIAPGAVFSFNRAVGPWSADRGFLKAPVSYDGEMVLDWGGGVCQTSSTLYNAALLAGLEIVERSPHTWAPNYVAAGRDAAVAQTETDLKIRNVYRYPVRIVCHITGDRLRIEIRGSEQGPMAGIVCETTSAEPARTVVRVAPRYASAGPYLLNRGKPGARAVVSRVFLKGPRAGEREIVSQDCYPAMSRLLVMPR